MARVFALATALLLVACGAAAAQADVSGWYKGWGPPPGSGTADQLDFNASGVAWEAPGRGRLTILFALEGARPSTVYQVGLHIFGARPERCPSPNLPNSMFGNFRASNGGGCVLIQAFNGAEPTITANGYFVELGAVLTDHRGAGSLLVAVRSIPAGTYKVKFHARADVGCFLEGGGCVNGNVLFQAPGAAGGRRAVFREQAEIVIR